jgi:hypothetical protein
MKKCMWCGELIFAYDASWLPILVHAQPTSKQFSHMLSIRGNPNTFQNRNSKYAVKQILSLAEHMWNVFHCWLSICGMYFIAG